MALTVTEMLDSRRHDFNPGQGSETFERTYKIEGTDNTGTAIAAAGIPAYNAAIEAGIGFDASPMRVTQKECWVLTSYGAGDGVCMVRVLYMYTWGGQTSSGSAGKDQFVIDITTEQAHITEAFSQTHYPNTAPSNSVGDRIGVVKGRADGCDVYSPIMELTETYVNTTFTAANRDTVKGMVGKTNSVAFRGLEVGEVLFVGCNAVRQDNGTWNVTYRFLCRQNRNSGNGNQLSITTVHGVQTVDKNGWDWIWFTVQENEDTNSNVAEVEIESVHVAVVYETVDFHGLPNIDP